MCVDCPQKCIWKLNFYTPIFRQGVLWYDAVHPSVQIAAAFPRIQWINTLRPGRNGRHFADDNFKCIFLNENICIAIEISLKFVPPGPINNTPWLVQIMAWRRPGDKPLSEPMMDYLLTHICVTRPQWVNSVSPGCITFRKIMYCLQERGQIFVSPVMYANGEYMHHKLVYLSFR